VLDVHLVQPLNRFFQLLPKNWVCIFSRFAWFSYFSFRSIYRRIIDEKS